MSCASISDPSPVQEILADFPTLTEADVRAVIAFAASSAEEDLALERGAVTVIVDPWHRVREFSPGGPQ